MTSRRLSSPGSELLAQISAPHFVAGIVLVGDVVTEAAPIVRWLKGKSRDEVRAICARKTWAIRVVTLEQG